MPVLKEYADRVKLISESMRAGDICMEEGAMQLQSLAVLLEQDAQLVSEEAYAKRMRKMADMIYSVVEKMQPEKRIMQ